jgi:hypothetical protein
MEKKAGVFKSDNCDFETKKIPGLRIQKGPNHKSETNDEIIESPIFESVAIKDLLERKCLQMYRLLVGNSLEG